MDGLSVRPSGRPRAAVFAVALAMLVALAILTGGARAQEAAPTPPEGFDSTKPPADEAKPEPVEHVAEPEGAVAPTEGEVASGAPGEAEAVFVANSSPFEAVEVAQAPGAAEPVFSVYKDFNAWWNEGRDDSTLTTMGKTRNGDWFTPAVADCKNGVSPEVDVAVFTSNSYGLRSTSDNQGSAECQGALEDHLRRGKTLIVDMGDNDYYGGFSAPGSSGTPTYRFPDDYSDATLTDAAKGPDRTLGTPDDHPMVKGPDGQAGTADDLTDQNVDACCYVAHGNLEDGVDLPANAKPLVTATFGGVQRPIVAEYAHAGGNVIVDTVTKEYYGQQPTGYGEPRFMRNLFEYAERLEGGAPEQTPPDPGGSSDLNVYLEPYEPLSVNGNGDLSPNPFSLPVHVANDGRGRLTDVNVSLAVGPDGLSFEPGGGPTLAVGDLEPGQEKVVEFVLRASEPAEEQQYTLQATAVADGAEPAVAYGDILVPETGRSFVAIGDSTTTGYGVETCSDTPGGQNNGYEFRNGCRTPQDDPPGVDPPARTRSWCPRS